MSGRRTERLVVHDPPAPLEWEIKAVRVTFDHRPVTDQLGIGTRRHRLIKVAAVIDIIVRQEDPADVVGLNKGEHVAQPLLAVGGRAGVDDHRLFAEDHHRIEIDEQWLAERGLHLVDHIGVERDLRRW